MTRQRKGGKTLAQSKIRVPIAPPTQAHAGKGDYLRPNNKRVVREELSAMAGENSEK